MDEAYPIVTSPSGVENQTEFDLANLVTEDDEPVDNIFSAKQQRCLLDPIYSSAKLQRPFLADNNVALYRTLRSAPIVPDMFLSLGVQVAEDWYKKENRSYLFSEFHKPPEVVVEIVSNQKGKEDTDKIRDYAALGVFYYVIYDPQQLLADDPIRVYQLVAGEYLLRPDYRLAEVGLSLTLWYGAFEDKNALWLRWCDLEGNLLPTSGERAIRADLQAERERARAEQERARADQERARAEQEQIRAQQANDRAKRLADQLRAHGIEPEQ